MRRLFGLLPMVTISLAFLLFLARPLALARTRILALPIHKIY